MLSLFLFICILSKTKQRYISIPLFLLLSFLISFNAYFAFIYNTTAQVGIMASIFETNTAEALSMSKDFILGATILFLLSSILLYLSMKEFRSSKISLKLSVFMLVGYCCFFIPIFLYVKKDTRFNYQYLYKSDPYTCLQTMASHHFSLIYGDVSTFVAYKREMSKLKQYLHTETVLPLGIQHADSAILPEKIFLVIGESSYARHYSLYGYPIATTPYLDSLSQSNVNMKFYDAIAPASLTRNAIRLILSFASAHDMIPFFKEKNIVELANDSGYETFWISSQDIVGYHDTYISIMAKKAKESYFDKSIIKNDLDLIPVIRQRNKPGKKQFFIIHLIGSHIEYADKSDEIDINAIPDAGNRVVNYDRSIHHTDRVLKEISQMVLENTSSLLYYISDHGEIINDGHGVMNGSVAQYIIPFVTINNSNVPLDSIVNKYIDTKDSLINSNSTVYILSEVLGYSIPQSRIEQAIADGRFVYQIDGNAYNYDDLKSKYPE